MNSMRNGIPSWSISSRAAFAVAMMAALILASRPAAAADTFFDADAFPDTTWTNELNWAGNVLPTDADIAHIQTGYLAVVDASVAVTGLELGVQAAPGSAGHLVVAPGGSLHVGNRDVSGGYAFLLRRDSTYVQNGDMTCSGKVVVGTTAGFATFTLSNGTATVLNSVELGSTGTTGTLVLAGGMLQANAVTNRGGQYGFSVAIFDGGVFRPTGVGTVLGGLSNATIHPGGLTLESPTAGITNTVTQSLLDGGGGLTKLGPGILQMTGSNTYRGGALISNGQLWAQNNALGTGDVTVADGGALFLRNGAQFSNRMTIAGTGGAASSGVLRASGGRGVLNGPVRLSGDALVLSSGPDLIFSNTVDVAGFRLGSLNPGGGTNAFRGGITGSGGLTVLGGATQLAASNDYAGVTLIAGGILLVGNGGTGGYPAPGVISNDASLVLWRSDDWTLTNTVYGTGIIVQRGSGRLTLGATNLHSGGIMTYGELTLIHAGGPGPGPIAVPSGGGVRLDGSAGALVITNEIRLRGGGAYGALRNIAASNECTGPVFLNENAVVNAANNALTLSGPVQGVGRLTVVGTGGPGGMIVLGAANSYSGGTTVASGILSISADGNLGEPAGDLLVRGTGILRIAADAALTRAVTVGAARGTFDVPAGITASVVSVIGGTGELAKTGAGVLLLGATNDYSGGTAVDGGVLVAPADESLGAAGAGIAFSNAGALALSAPVSLNRPVTLGEGGGAFSVAAGVTVTLAQAATGVGGLAKAGAGVLVLAASNTYAGATVVAEGALLVQGALAESGSVEVAAGAVLGGGGTIAGPVTNGGVVAPGASAGVLTLGGDFEQTAAGALRLEIGGPAQGTDYDLLSVLGTATLGGTLEVHLANGYQPAGGETFVVLSSTVAQNDFAATDLPPLLPGLGWTVANDSFEVSLGVTGVVAAAPYVQWQIQYGITNGAETADADGDGGANLLEYALGTDPTNPVSAAVVRGSVVSNHLRMTFSRNTNATDITLFAEAAPGVSPGNVWTTVATWAGGWSGPAAVSDIPTGATAAVWVEDPAASAPSRFMRLRVNKP